MKISNAVEICNLALVRIEQNSISSLDDKSVQGQFCKMVYEQSKSSLLSRYNWTFAITTSRLTRLDTTELIDYKYSYQLPADFLRLVGVYSGTDTELIQITGYKPPFILEGDVIKSDVDTIKIKYVRDVDTVATFSPLFVDCFVLDLAIRLTKLFNSSTTYLQMLTMEFAQKIAEAKISDCQQTMLNQIRSYPLLFSTWEF